MFSQPLVNLKNEAKMKTPLRAKGSPGVSGALCSLRILRIGRIGSLCILHLGCLPAYKRLTRQHP